MSTWGRLAWSVGEHACHVVDNLRIRAERVAAMAGRASCPVGVYDDDLLARVVKNNAHDAHHHA